VLSATRAFIMIMNGRNYKEFSVTIESRCGTELEMILGALNLVLDSDPATGRQAVVHALCVLQDNPKKGIVWALAYALELERAAKNKPEPK
jgi:hypothetical protein